MTDVKDTSRDSIGNPRLLLDSASPKNRSPLSNSPLAHFCEMCPMAVNTTIREGNGREIHVKLVNCCGDDIITGPSFVARVFGLPVQSRASVSHPHTHLHTHLSPPYPPLHSSFNRSKSVLQVAPCESNNVKVWDRHVRTNLTTSQTPPRTQSLIITSCESFHLL